ncbi:hypothetical protein [uncultured Erythrobacter sp.]|uniref:hypothetical protein n=1 Tax=uncultured Erythrobacter sp. TaxID=263913 RepID=UPI0026314D63|nr:hypothetical protein [uncultured Erythrobacter sp.]
MEREVGLSLFMIGMGGWLFYLGISGIRDLSEARDEPDDFFEADHPDLYITVIGILLIMGFAAIALGLYILLA